MPTEPAEEKIHENASVCEICTFILACCSSAAKVFSRYFGCGASEGGDLRYISTHVGIPAEFCGGALSAQRR